MDYVIKSGIRTGEVLIPASKSYAHRYLIGAALSGVEVDIVCDKISKDIKATIDCLNALGSDIEVKEDHIYVKPMKSLPGEEKQLYCNESGSTLRFLIPLVGALGENAVFHMEGRLAKRPLTELTDVLTSKGMKIELDGNLLRCSGKLRPGFFSIPGNISSQYITGLLLALPLLEEDSTLKVTGKRESEDYVVMTEDVLSKMKISFEKNEDTYSIKGLQTYYSPGFVEIERDWSNACFFLCMGALSQEGVTLRKMNLESCQGDRRCMNITKSMGAFIENTENGIIIKKDKLSGIYFDAASVPDLVPSISALAALSEGVTTVFNAGRLRDKESDRIQSTVKLINDLGGEASETEDGLVIKGKGRLRGGKIDAMNDHRIAMAAAVAACGCLEEVTVMGAECVSKSYPDFWRDFEALEVKGE